MRYLPNTDFRIMRTETDSIGTHVRLEQTYVGLRVLGGEAIVQLDPAGNVSSITSSIMVNTASLDDGTAPLKPVVTAAAADGAARLAMDATLQNRVAEEVAALTPAGAARGAMTTETASAVDALSNATLHARSAPELMIYDPRLLGGEGAPRAVWALDIESDPSDLVNERVFVDAETGETQLIYSLTHYARNRQIWTANLCATTATPPSAIARTENQTPTGVTDVDNNYSAMGLAYNYFSTNHGFDSFDNAGSAIRSYVRWNSSSISGWNSTGEYFYFGANNYAQAVDIVAHEYTHAVTAHHSGLLPTGEPGAINEAFSDIWGEFIDWSAGDPGANRWLIGQALPGTPNGAIRNMANPAQFNQPSYVNSALFYQGGDLSVFAAVNSGVCNKLFYLLANGDTFNEYTVTGLGLTSDGKPNVLRLLWQCQLTQQFTSSASFHALYAALGQAAIDLGFDTGQRDSIEKACRAVGINCDLSSGPSPGKGLEDINIWTGLAQVIDDPANPVYHGGKDIPYKVYVPRYDLDVGGDTPGRGITHWPLDVVILSHGAGMCRTVASDGLAMYWARKGYIVVCPTHRKLMSGKWEAYADDDSIKRFSTDMTYSSTSTLAGELFADRILDIKYIRDNLAAILNVGEMAAKLTYPTHPACYDDNTSRVALAGHSLGSVTALMAAGVKWSVGGTPIDLTQYHNLRRTIQAPGHENDPLYDSGPFVSGISAYLSISAGTYTDGSTLTVIDPNYPNLTGQDLMQQPYMLLSGTNDVLQNMNGQLYAVYGGTPCYHDAVLKPYGVCPSPAYAVIMNGANHITPVSRFSNLTSSTFGDGWLGITNFLNTTSNYFNNVETPTYEKAAFTDFITWVINVAFSMFPSGQNTPAQEAARLGEFEHYSLAFLDTYLSSRYDIAGSDDLGSTFLGHTEATHQQRPLVNSQNGFRYSPPTHALIIKSGTGAPLVQFQSDGNAMVLQANTQNKNNKIHQQTSIADNPNVAELLVKNAAGTVVAKVDSTTGELSVKGIISPQQTTLAPSSNPELVINDSATVAQVILDAVGNLKLRGKVFVAGGTYP